MNDEKSIWQQSWTLDSGQSHLWKLGPLELWIGNDQGVWVVSHRTDHDPLVERQDDRAGELAEVPTEEREFQILRTMGSSSQTVRLKPALADRAVVIRPEVPTQVAPHGEAAFFMTTPIWVQVFIGDSVIADLPSYRPSDTWFGEPAGEGELSYASRTQASPTPDRLQVRPTRAMTKAVFKNETDTSILIERFSLPATALSLYLAANGRLWTESVTVTNRDETQRSDIRFSSRVAQEAEGAERFAGPRAESTRNMLSKALHKLVG